MSAGLAPRLLLRCTCCQKEILGEVVNGDTLIFFKKRHGQEHQLVIKIDNFALIGYALPIETLHPTPIRPH
jgi:hypothetical protein